MRVVLSVKDPEKKEPYASTGTMYQTVRTVKNARGGRIAAGNFARLKKQSLVRAEYYRDDCIYGNPDFVIFYQI